jgi:hypothetical protein
MYISLGSLNVYFFWHEDVSENPNDFVENFENAIDEIVDDFVENIENITKNRCTDEVRDDEYPCDDEVS